MIAPVAPGMLAATGPGKAGFYRLGAALWGFGNFDAPDVIFNGIDINGVTWALNAVQGWKKTTGEVPLQRAPGADGGWFGPGTRAPRVMTVTGAFRADTAAKLIAAEDQLRAAIEHTAEDTLLWVDGIRQLQMSVRLTGDLDVDDTNPWFRTFSAVLTAADPYKYAAGGAGLVVATAGMPQLSGLGGAQFPAQFPLDFGGGNAAVGRLTIVNPGTVSAWPVVSYTTPTGVLDTPTLKHIGLQQVDGFSGVLQPNDVAALDHGAQSVLLNGQSAYAHRIPGCSFFPLLKGQNDLFFTANAYNAAATVTVTYRPRWS